MNYEINFSSLRAHKVRLGKLLSKFVGGLTVKLVILLLIVADAYLFLSKTNSHLTYLFLAITFGYYTLALWYRYDLQVAEPVLPAKSLDDILGPSMLKALSHNVTPKTVWQAATKTREGIFICNRLLLSSSEIIPLLSDTTTDVLPVWQIADELRNRSNDTRMHGDAVITAFLIGYPPIKSYLESRKLTPQDVMEVFAWSERLQDYIRQPKPYFGGIGRDWSTGFTPTLERFSQNISALIESGGKHFHFLAHADVADSIIHALAQGSGGVALVGQVGTGKTSLVYGLAERLLEGRDDSLKHYKVVSLNASMILSANKNELEKLVLTLFSEAIASGNMILFLDEASLFFGDGLGSFNMSQILLPVIQSHRLKIVAAFTPNDFQKLKTANEALINSFTIVNVSEPSLEDTNKIIEDSALTLEARTGLLVTYEAIREAMRLSDQYMSDQAYPGKAINLLDQAVPYAVDKIMLATSVQTAIEKTLGVKAGNAQAAEVDVLLHLEDQIHERMINQTQAVSAVASALRRMRAGVTNTKRPVGSFLFLGPTGVGKTELARSLAATYFGDVQSMVRLDMSEYQRPDDVARILSAGNEGESLIMAIRKQPFSVVLLDEVEKSHSSVLNLLLQLLDEGQLTDVNGRTASFRNAIIIATSNAGSADIIQQIVAGSTLESFERPLIDKLIQTGIFKPELVNRFDEVVLFRPLNQTEIHQVAGLMIDEVNHNLSRQNIQIELTDAALTALVEVGYDPEFGARPMRHVIQKNIEDLVATKILEGHIQPGGKLVLDVNDIGPVKK